MQDLPKFWSFNRSKDSQLILTEEVQWSGPFSWPKYEKATRLPSLPDIAGVYLLTFEYQDGYILRSVGVTSSTKKRIYQHTRAYMNGSYTILDIGLAKQGFRQELWHRWSYARENKHLFYENKDYLVSAIHEELSAYRLFTASVAEKRKRERIEFSIMHNAYHSRMPWADLVDGGMHLIGRSNYQAPVLIKNNCLCKIYGLADSLEI